MAAHDRDSADIGECRSPLLSAWEELLWPRLLRSVGLAVRPQRIGIALFTLAIVLLIAQLAAAATEGAGPVALVVARLQQSWGMAWGGLLAMELAPLIEAGALLLYRLPGELVADYPVSTPLVLLPIMAVLAVGGGAIARSAACEFSQSVFLTWPQALGFAGRFSASLIGAVLGPLVLIALLALLLAVGGLLFAVPVLDVAAAVLYALFLLGSLAAVLVFVAYLLGGAMLVPAVACEGTDGVDAVQRAYAYVFGRPLRLIGYGAVLVVLGIVAVGAALLLAVLVVEFAAVCAAAFGGVRAAVILGGAPLEEPSGVALVASRIVSFWTTLALLLAGAFAVSYFFCASTALYLLLRQVNDGQDVGELWMPGEIERSMAEALEGRARAGADAMPPPEAAPGLSRASEEP